MTTETATREAFLRSAQKAMRDEDVPAATAGRVMDRLIYGDWAVETGHAALGAPLPVAADLDVGPVLAAGRVALGRRRRFAADPALERSLRNVPRGRISRGRDIQL